MTSSATRRCVIAGLASATLARSAVARAKPRVVVIGGGFGGATAARELAGRVVEAVLVEPLAHYACCPLSNAVLVGLRPMSAQVFDYAGLARSGVAIRRDAAVAIDADAKRVRLSGGDTLSYDRLIVSPGIALRYDAIPGYDLAASERMPHAWKAGAQTELLARQLDAMEDGGLVVVTVPELPYRCPPGPYERASLIAHYLKLRKPRSKVLILDAKDSFSKQPLFEAAWKALYPQHLEWVPRSKGGRLLEADPGAMTLKAEAGLFRAAVANVIPPQRAPEICVGSGLAEATGWCRVEPLGFESKRRPGIHVIGDAAVTAMPKSAFSANAQGAVCAQAVADLLEGRELQPPKMINVCYSLIAPGRAVSIANVYEIEWDVQISIPEAGGISPLDAPDSLRMQEAAHGEAWFRTVTREVFG